MTTLNFQLAGRRYVITRDDVLRAARGAIPEPVRTFYVEIGGKRFPPTQLVRIAASTVTSPYSFNSRSILTKLEFNVRSQE